LKTRQLAIAVKKDGKNLLVTVNKLMQKMSHMKKAHLRAAEGVAQEENSKT